MPRPDLDPVSTAVESVIEDVQRARSMVHDALAKLMMSFSGLREHLEIEKQRYEQAVSAIAGDGVNAGLMSTVQDVLGRFVSDIVKISGSSVRIMVEAEALKTHAAEVASRGARIEHIAQTTRVISLNARIEANRFGTAGAVFRVVADEIKKLALESAELSQAIREAIARQSESLARTNEAAAAVASTDLDLVVDSNKQFEGAVSKLEAVSSASRQALVNIQRDIDDAIQALQFEDLVNQLLQSVIVKLEAVRRYCRTGDGTAADALLTAIEHNTVPQKDLERGAMELF